MSDTKPETQKPKKRIGKLDTLGGVLKEMANVYREARRDELDSLEATRLVSILRDMRAVLEVAEIEPRLQALEQTAEEQNNRRSK